MKSKALTGPINLLFILALIMALESCAYGPDYSYQRFTLDERALDILLYGADTQSHNYFARHFADLMHYRIIHLDKASPTEAQLAELSLALQGSLDELDRMSQEKIIIAYRGMLNVGRDSSELIDNIYLRVSAAEYPLQLDDVLANKIHWIIVLNGEGSAEDTVSFQDSKLAVQLSGNYANQLFIGEKFPDLAALTKVAASATSDAPYCKANFLNVNGLDVLTDMCKEEM